MLKGERELLFALLYAMDGNDSLKRILRRYPSIEGDPDAPGSTREHTDTRTVPDGMYISRNYVDKWARELVSEAKAVSEDVSSSPCSSAFYLLDAISTNVLCSDETPRILPLGRDFEKCPMLG
jgi:hypothetical protein